MIFLQAFIVCGVVCAICQFIIMKTKIPFPLLITLLLVIGGLLGLLGVFGALVGFGMMGTIVLIASLSDNFMSGFLAAIQGDFTGLIATVILLCTIIIFCTICAIVAKLPPPPPPSSEESEQPEK